MWNLPKVSSGTKAIIHALSKANLNEHEKNAFNNDSTNNSVISNDAANSDDHNDTASISLTISETIDNEMNSTWALPANGTEYTVGVFYYIGLESQKI